MPAVATHPSRERGLTLRVHGVVQGVGFRPYVHRLAVRHHLAGWVRNAGGWVEIEVEGAGAELEAFTAALRAEAPPLARIEGVEVVAREAAGHSGFTILGSRVEGGAEPVPADAATCPECLAELRDPTDRRHGYAFTNCTQCGPRFTVIDALPYDRERTTMREFVLCEACLREYGDPSDRRFHAEPVACPACGPRLWLHAPTGAAPEGDPVAACVARLRSGGVVALKGLGGFQLACDAASEAAVARLRERKHRPDKPFAVMVPELEAARAICRVSEREAALLGSSAAPIVLLERMPGAGGIAPSVAPGLDALGVMLPYTPLHHLLLPAFGAPLVMTSGNLSEEPIAVGNAEALARLGGIADLFLLHDRDIRARYDDSVVRVMDGEAVPVRRARGYAPVPIRLPERAAQDIVACGGQQKGAFCLVKGDRAYLSQHLGDLDNVETVDAWREALELYRRLFQVEPRVVAHDLHPDYASTALAHELRGEGVVHIGVQHHHAHVVSCMAEHGLEGPVIGVAFDGTGYGTDGAVWGGEVLIADWASFRRHAHLEYVPMLGGEAAVLRPWRMAAGLIRQLCPTRIGEFQGFFDRLEPRVRTVLHHQFETRFNAPPTSSCGRLFDAVAALLGVCWEASYEGEPAAELEAAADPAVDYHYPFQLRRGPEAWRIDPGAALQALWRDHASGAPVGVVAGAFHNTVVEMALAACRTARMDTGLERVCLSGGCFQNRVLTEGLARRLRGDGFEVYLHRRVPPNDGGLAVGQALAALGMVQR